MNDQVSTASSGAAKQTGLSYTFVVSRILLGVAWLLLVICMFLPQGGVIYRDSQYSLNGWQVALMAPIFGPLSFFSIMTSSTTGSLLQTTAVTIFLSELLFVASPVVLLMLNPGRLASRGIYALLSLICTILLVPLSLNVVSQLDPTTSELQFLPGLLVWAAAQDLLTLAAGLQLVQLYLVKRRQLVW